MKNSTNNINLLRFLVPLLFLFFSNTNLYSQASEGMDLRDCIYNCTSNNYTITDVFLSDTDVLPGNHISNTDCIPGEEQEVWIIIDIMSNQAGDVYHARFFADLTVNSNPTLVINEYLGVLNGKKSGVSTKVVYGPFNWSCGDLLTLENTLVTWVTSAPNPPDPITYDCSDYSKSQCQFPTDAIVSTPLAVQYDYTACTDDTTNIATVTFESTTNGGSGVYVSYVWDYDGGNFIGGTASNPIVEYDTTGGPYYPTLKVTDDEGNSNTFDYPYPLVALVLPSELKNTPFSIDLTCSVNDGSGTFTASDGTPPYTFNVDSDTTGSQSINIASTVLSFTNAGVGTITVTITDDAGCTATESITIVIGDITPPNIDSPAIDSTIECDGSGNTTALNAWLSTNAGASASDVGVVTWSNDFTALSDDCGSTGSATVTFTAMDDCGNKSTTQATFTIQDTTDPIFVEALPADTTVECDAVPSAVTLTATDNCGTASVNFGEVNTPGSCPGEYSLVRTWTATDECNNTTVHTQTITVVDTTAPMVTTEYDEELNAICGEIPDAPELEFEDACSTNIDVSFEETSTFSGSPEDYEIIRTWTVSDECNNVEVYTQNVFVTIESDITGNDTELCVGEDFNFDLFDLLSGNFDTGGTWEVTVGNATTDGSLFNPFLLELGIHSFTYSDNNSECPSETVVNITLNDECIVLACGDADEVIISKAVTANGDQWNEYFTVTGIELCGFTVEVQIFNRWGAKIYESNDYQNNWNGFTHNNSVGGSDKVPTGTYYYIINLSDSGLKPFAGPIYVGTK